MLRKALLPEPLPGGHSAVKSQKMGAGSGDTQ